MPCFCSPNPENSGFKGNSAGSVARGLIWVPRYANDGTRNAILAADVIDETYFQNKVNETDPSKRWYPLGLWDNIDDNRADVVTETLASGDDIAVQQGKRTFNGVAINQTPKFKGILDSYGCHEGGVYDLSRCKALRGEESEDGLYLYPFPVNKSSWRTLYVKATDTTVRKVNLIFDYDSSADDELISEISASEMNGYNVLNLGGLYDITVTQDGATAAAEITVDLTFLFGTFQNKIPIQGLLLADFTLYNNTTPAAVVISAVTELSAGKYKIEFPAQIAADEMTLTISKTGYAITTFDFDAV